MYLCNKVNLSFIFPLSKMELYLPSKEKSLIKGAIYNSIEIDDVTYEELIQKWGKLPCFVHGWVYGVKTTKDAQAVANEKVEKLA
jgi:hypothetical protein